MWSLTSEHTQPPWVHGETMMHGTRKPSPIGSPSPGVPNGRFPRLPQTKAALETAENEVLQFQLPPIPGASQTFPVQPAGAKPVPHVTASTAGVV